MTTIVHTAVPALAFLQSTQLNVFERFLNQAVTGIDSASITAGMQKVAYVVLLVGFLWQVYQSALHGGDVRGLGGNLAKYVVTTVVVMNYHAIFTTINQGFVDSGNWVNNSSGASNLFDNWASDLQTQFAQVGFQKLWGLVTADIPGLIDALLIIVAYILYPVVIVIFGFFYMLYGSILYIFGPIVIGMMPLGATNRLAKSYVENIFIWNAWPILYGGFGALLSAVQMGQIGQMLNQNNFLGGLGNLEGSILIGLASIIYSLAIAVIPFIAKRIVSGDVGATVSTLLGAAAAAVAIGAAGAEGIAAGASGSAGAAQNPTSPAGQTGFAGSGSGTAGGGVNQPAVPQRAAGTSPAFGPESSAPATAAQRVADDIRSGFSGAFSVGSQSEGSEGANPSPSSSAEGQGETVGAVASGASPSRAKTGGAPRGPSAALSRPRGLASWGAYHAARIATRAMVAPARAATETKRSV